MLIAPGIATVIPEVGVATVELAKLMGRHPKTVEKNIRRGKIAAAKITGTYIISPREVKRLVPGVQI